MFCYKCGKQLEDEAKFCTACGARQDEQPMIHAAATPSLLSDAGDEPTVHMPVDDLFDEEPTALLNESTSYVDDDLSAAPQSALDDTPTSLLSDAPASALDDTPTSLLSDAPASALDDTPTSLLSDAPASALDDTPTSLLSDAPASALDDTPTSLLSDSLSAVNDTPTELIDDDNISASALDNEDTVQLEPVGLYDASGDQPTVHQSVEDDEIIDFGTTVSDASETAPINNIPAPPPVMPVNQGVQNGAPMGGQPVYPQPQPQFQPQPAAPAPMPPQKQKAKVGGGRITGATIVSVFATIFLLFVSIALCIRFGASGEILEKRINKLDENTIFSAKYQGEEISKDMYNSLGFRSLTEGYADEASFKKYIVRTNILEFIGSHVKDYADYIIEGKGDDPSVTASVIKDEFFADDDNNDVADEEFGYPLGKNNLKELKSRLNDNDIDTTLSVKEWNKKAGFDLKNLNYALSFVTIGIVGAVVLVLLIWIAVIVDKRGKHLMGFYGNIFFISGLILFLIGAAILAGAAVVFTITGNVVFYIIANVLLPFGLAALGSGVVWMLLGFIFKKVRKSIKRKEKASVN